MKWCDYQLNIVLGSLKQALLVCAGWAYEREGQVSSTQAARVYWHWRDFTDVFSDQYQADKGTNHGSSYVQDSSKHKYSAKVGVPEHQNNTSATGRSKYGSLNVQGH